MKIVVFHCLLHESYMDSTYDNYLYHCNVKHFINEYRESSKSTYAHRMGDGFKHVLNELYVYMMYQK